MQIRIFIFSFLLIGMGHLQAEVIDSTDAGFTVVHTVEINSSADQVYHSLIKDFGQWWEDAHSFSGHAANFRLEARAGGCLCESLPGGGEVKHLEVIHVNPGHLLRLSGGLGPLQSMAVNGAMTWSLEEEEGKTQLSLTYTVGGYVPGGLQEISAAVDYVLGVQISKLKAFVEGAGEDVEKD